MTALRCYDTNVRLFTYLKKKLFSLVENIELWWIMGKQKNCGWKSTLWLDRIDFIDIDWLISVDSLISTCLTRWFDLFNYNPLEQKYHRRIWLIRTQALQILWASVHILMHALNTFATLMGGNNALPFNRLSLYGWMNSERAWCKIYKSK